MTTHKDLSVLLGDCLTTLTVTIEDLSHSGDGIAHITQEQSPDLHTYMRLSSASPAPGDSAHTPRITVFIPLTAPGDVVKIKIHTIEKRYIKADVLQLITPSHLRREPKCSAFGRCGGCSWQHLPYDLQWNTKIRGARQSLARLQVPAPSTQTEFQAKANSSSAGGEWAYRNRIQLRGFREHIGFYARQSQDLAPIRNCSIARKELNAMLEETKKHGKKLNKPYKVELEVFSDKTTRTTWNAGHAAQGFRQVNDAQNEKLKAWVKAAALKTATTDSTLLDLYGGSGNLSLDLCSNFTQIHIVDIGCPEKTPARTPKNVTFHRTHVGNWMRKTAENLELSHCIAILDPPREGMANDFETIVSVLENKNCSRLVLVGCDPDSWARDLSQLCKRKWSIEEIAFIDLFPQTPHLESLAVLSR